MVLASTYERPGLPPLVVTVSNASRNFQVSSGEKGGKNHPLLADLPLVENHWFSLQLVKASSTIPDCSGPLQAGGWGLCLSLCSG